jgi:hypothetical protein
MAGGVPGMKRYFTWSPELSGKPKSLTIQPGGQQAALAVVSWPQFPLIPASLMVTRRVSAVSNHEARDAADPSRRRFAAPQSLTGNAANSTAELSKLVMPGLDPGIHVLIAGDSKKDVDGRVKPGHDEN